MIFAGKPTIDLPGLRQLTFEDGRKVWGAFPMHREGGMQIYHIVFKNEDKQWYIGEVTRGGEEDSWTLNGMYAASHATSKNAWVALAGTLLPMGYE